jgi:thiaminase/transcriptional activator TenA
VVDVFVSINYTLVSVKRPAVFDAWIDMYGGEDFAKEVREYIAMVNVACADPSSDVEQMKDHFIMSCKLEHMFWDQAACLMQWPEL